VHFHFYKDFFKDFFVRYMECRICRLQPYNACHWFGSNVLNRSVSRSSNVRSSEETLVDVAPCNMFIKSVVASCPFVKLQ